MQPITTVFLALLSAAVSAQEELATAFVVAGPGAWPCAELVTTKDRAVGTSRAEFLAWLLGYYRAQAPALLDEDLREHFERVTRWCAAHRSVPFRCAVDEQLRSNPALLTPPPPLAKCVAAYRALVDRLPAGPSF